MILDPDRENISWIPGVMLIGDLYAYLDRRCEQHSFLRERRESREGRLSLASEMKSYILTS